MEKPKFTQCANFSAKDKIGDNRMNAEITRIRTELNEAIYIMIEADSDKRYNIAERHVSYLRRTLRQAMKDWLYPRTCNYCDKVLGGNEIIFCIVCSDDIEEDDDYEEEAWCQHCGNEMEPDGSDYCETCWPGGAPRGDNRMDLKQYFDYVGKFDSYGFTFVARGLDTVTYWLIDKTTGDERQIEDDELDQLDDILVGLKELKEQYGL